jgi:hypothetical protein
MTVTVAVSHVPDFLGNDIASIFVTFFSYLSIAMSIRVRLIHK